MFASVTGVRVEAQSAPEPTAFKLADDAVVVDWLVPIVISVPGDSRIDCEAETIQDDCSLYWCAFMM